MPSIDPCHEFINAIIHFLDTNEIGGVHSAIHIQGINMYNRR
jgi:hypothetical protein